MKKRLGIFLFLAVALLSVWYFAIKKDDYQVSFETKNPPTVVYHHILAWKADKTNGIDEIIVEAKTPGTEVVQKVRINDSIFKYTWQFEKTKDSLTRVSVGISDRKNRMAQRIEVPFADNAFVKRSVKNVKDVGEALVEKSKRYRVHSITDSLFQGKFCAYLPLTSQIDKKATTMLFNIPDIMGYINENEIELDGDPFLEVTHWDKEDQIIEYNFCFPIKKLDSLPISPIVKFKQIPSFRGLKAEFNGNYSISNNAWYYLLDHAASNNLKVKELPVELYLDDPHSGGDAMNWKAHIFLPLEN